MKTMMKKGMMRCNWLRYVTVFAILPVHFCDVDGDDDEDDQEDDEDAYNA